MNAEIQRLRAEIRNEREVLEHKLREVVSVPLDDLPQARLAQLAVALHHAYGVVEGILARVARYIEGSVPEGPDWYQTRLTTMTLEIEGVLHPYCEAKQLRSCANCLDFGTSSDTPTQWN